MKDSSELSTSASSVRSELEPSRSERGRRLKIVREELARSTPVEFARQLSVGKSSVLRYEAGERAPDAEYLASLSKTFGVGLDWLVTGEGPMRPNDVPPLRPTTLDAAVLAQAIEAIEGALREGKKKMPLDRRAEMIKGNYEALMGALPENRKALAEQLKALHTRHLAAANKPADFTYGDDPSPFAR